VRPPAAPPPRLSQGVKIVIGLLMLIVLAVVGISYGFLRLATP
jgi:Tfp pilus assembly protein PilX